MRERAEALLGAGDGVAGDALGAESLGKALALRDVQTAVITIFHEIGHHQSYRALGHGGTEGTAEQYGQRMYERFVRRWV